MMDELYELKYNAYMMIHDTGNEAHYLSEIKEILKGWTPWETKQQIAPIVCEFKTKKATK